MASLLNTDLMAEFVHGLAKNRLNLLVLGHVLAGVNYGECCGLSGQSQRGIQIHLVHAVQLAHHPFDAVAVHGAFEPLFAHHKHHLR
jgi:hypothetical protein